MKDDETISRRYALFRHLLLLLVMLAVLAVRIRLLDIPLERDEGEYAYMGQLLLDGVTPYAGAYTMKLPGVSICYALFMALFGQTPFGIHLGLLLVNMLSSGMVWLLARSLFCVETAAASTMIYALLSLSQGVFGVFAHATNFVMLFVLAGFLLLLRFLASRRLYPLFFSGLCFGLAFTMKQHAVVLTLFAGLYLLWQTRKSGGTGKYQLLACGLFTLGAVIPYAAIVLWMWQAGVFGQFWFWTVEYARDYASGRTLADGVQALTSATAYIASLQLPVWIFAAIGLVLLLRRRDSSGARLLVPGFLVSSFLAMCPGLVFRRHYFILILVPIALLAGLFVTKGFHMVRRGVSLRMRYAGQAVLLVMLLGYGFYTERVYLFLWPPSAISRDLYGLNPFLESVAIARHPRAHTTRNDRIAVLGSEPEIYFYAHRRSATGHIYMYGLMENQPHAVEMQQEMIREIETAQPEYFVNVSTDTSWLMKSYSAKDLIIWGNDYISKRYRKVGVIDIYSDYTVYRWDDQVAGYVPGSPSFVTVWKRKDNS